MYVFGQLNISDSLFLNFYILFSLVLEAGKDMVRITWMLKSTAKVDGDAAFRTVEVKLCYANQPS